MKKLSLSVLAIAMGLSAAPVFAANAGHADIYYVAKTEVEVDDDSGKTSADDNGFGAKGEYAFSVNEDMSVLVLGELQQGKVKDEEGSADLDKWLIGAGLQFGSNPRVAGILDYRSNELSGGDIKIEDEGFGAHVRVSFDVVENLELMAQFGFSKTDIKAEGESVDADGPAWMLGAAYKFTPQFGAFIDYRGSDSDISESGADATISYNDLRLGARFFF